MLFCALGCAFSIVAQTVPSTGQLIYAYPQALNGLGIFGLRNRTEVFNEARTDISDALKLGVSSEANFTNLRPAGFERPLNIGIATQLSALPIASPASGVIFKKDAATGDLLPAADSLGPVLTERAETIGARRFYLGFTRQQFRFDRLEGQPLGGVSNLYVGGDPTNITQAGVPVTTSPIVYNTQIDLRIDQNVAFFTYGLTDRIDVSAALTWVNSTMSVLGFNAREVNSGNPGDGGTCWCAATLDVRASQADVTTGGAAGFTRNIFGSARSSSTGIGDTIIRVKGTALQKTHYALGIGADLRLPTGDELNYHGSGAIGFKPFAALSLHSGNLGGVRISPHFNVGYQVNGESILAGDPVANTKARIPNQFTWAAGAAVGISRRVTFVADILGTRLMDSFRMVNMTVPGRGTAAGTATGMTLSPDKQSFNMNNGSFGLKLKTVGNLVLTANMLVALNDAGLRDKYVPLFGLGYSF
jgi:hypothetical protein